MKNREGPMQADMPASVRDALDALSPVPAPDSDVWAANRVAFLDQARAFAREAALPPVSANAPIPWWRRLGESVALGKAFLLYDRGPVAVALKAVLVIAVALAASTGTVSAARGSLPGSLLYPLKVRLEAREMARARTPDAIARTALAHADVRVEEATRLQRKGDPVPEETAVRYEQQLELALSAAGDRSRGRAAEHACGLSLRGCGGDASPPAHPRARGFQRAGRVYGRVHGRGCVPHVCVCVLRRDVPGSHR